MKLKLPSREDAAVDMAPMIDLVFLLLIFFMVASVVTKLEKVEVDIPESKYATQPDNTQGRIILSVDANNQIYVRMDPVTVEELKDRLAAELALNKDLRVLIRADNRVLYKTCKEIMIACGDVEISDLIYATFEE